MATTTIKVSTETRDRIRGFGGDTHEATIVAALDALEEERFWAQAQRARRHLDADPEVRAAVAAEAQRWDDAIVAVG